MQSVLALLKGRRVSLKEVSRRLLPQMLLARARLEPRRNVMHEYYR
jgi:hypothetical protein